jgi:Nicotinamide mononucleotide transporter
MNWLVYIAAAVVFLSYWLIPRKRTWGWGTGVLGNLLYVVAFVPYGRIELLVAPVGFTALSAWNLWQELRRKSSS